MLYRWPDKDPEELLDFTVDWSLYLSGDTISTVNWYCVDASGVKQAFNAVSTVNGLVNSSNSFTTTTTTVYLGGGVANTTYQVSCQIGTNTGRTVERTIRLRVRQF